MPAKKITVDKLVDILEKSEKPVLDASRLGDELNVSAHAVRNYTDELTEHEGVESMKIGRTNVYFRTGDSKSHSFKKISSKDVQRVLDNREKHGYAQYTAAMLAEIIKSERDDIDELDTETTRRHADALADDPNADVKKFKLGPRTVLYGKHDDHKRVASSNGPSLVRNAGNGESKMRKLKKYDINTDSENWKQELKSKERTAKMGLFIILILFTVIIASAALYGALF